MKASLIRKRRIGWSVFILGAVLLLVIYACFDPMSAWWMPKCPVKFLTGYDCPGCGSQRAIHSLLRGNVADAFSANALFIAMIPFLALMGYSELSRTRHPRLYRMLCHPAVIGGILVAVIAWAVFRNLNEIK